MRPRDLLARPHVRLGLAVAAALLWFSFIIAAEAGRNPGFAVFYAAPAVVVFAYWRVRPWLALGFSMLTLVLVLFAAANGTPVNGGGILACTTAWLAVLGASIADEDRLRWASMAFVGLDALLALANSGIVGFLLVAFFGGLALAAGWAWRQRRAQDVLVDRLDETTERGEAAERDVLLELERNRLAREVHDVVAHSLAVVIAQADGARFAAETKPESVAPALEAISDTARRALGEVRTMLHDLRTSGEGGVVPGAEDLAGLIEGVRGLGVEVDEAVYGEPAPLDRAQGLALYRVAQEALTNAMRHGDRVEPVGFEIDWGEREVVLVVTNAVPVDVAPATERAGHGVTGMRERAADAGGDCTAGVGSNGRFRVRVALPITAPLPAQAEPAAQPNALAVLLGFVEQPARG